MHEIRKATLQSCDSLNSLDPVPAEMPNAVQENSSTLVDDNNTARHLPSLPSSHKLASGPLAGGADPGSASS